MCAHWSFLLNLRWSILQSIHQFIHPAIHVCRLIRPSKSLLVHPSHLPSVCPSIHLSIHLPVYSSFPLCWSCEKLHFRRFFTCHNSERLWAQGWRNDPESPHVKVKNAAIFDTGSESDELMSRNWIVCIIAGSSCAEAIMAKPGTRAQLKKRYCPFETSASGRLEGCCEREKDTPSLSPSLWVVFKDGP